MSRERFKFSVAVFLIVKKDNKILLLKRANTGWMDGYFSIPAGAINGNESLLEAVIREAKEEVGIVVDPNDVTLVHTIHCFTHGEEFLGQFFMTEKWEGTPKVNEPKKHSEIKWVEINSLPPDVITYVAQAIKNVGENSAYSTYKDNDTSL